MTKPDPIRILSRLHMVAALVRRILEEGSPGPGGALPYSTRVLLRWLEMGGRRRPQDVARFLSVTPSAATQMVGRLKRRGLVRAQPDPEDGRAELLSLTAKGAALVRNETKLEASRMEGFLARVPEPRRRVLAQGLEEAIELLLSADPTQIDLCLHCTALSSPHCELRRHGLRCPTERPPRRTPDAPLSDPPRPI
jgi:DNA-binding MarR family transcriptional regulator